MLLLLFMQKDMTSTFKCMEVWAAHSSTPLSQNVHCQKCVDTARNAGSHFGICHPPLSGMVMGKNVGGHCQICNHLCGMVTIKKQVVTAKYAPLSNLMVTAKNTLSSMVTAKNADSHCLLYTPPF